MTKKTVNFSRKTIIRGCILETLYLFQEVGRRLDLCGAAYFFACSYPSTDIAQRFIAETKIAWIDKPGYDPDYEIPDETIKELPGIMDGYVHIQKDKEGLESAFVNKKGLKYLKRLRKKGFSVGVQIKNNK